VLPTVFLVPLGIVGLEYYIGQLIRLEHVRVVYEEQLVDPWDLLMQKLDAPEVPDASCLGSSASHYTLADIAFTPRKKCPEGQRRMINFHNPIRHAWNDERKLIPRIVHQHSDTRCLTMRVDRTSTKWAFHHWSYYIHDEESRDRLFEKYCGDFTQSCEFPLLCQIVSKCFRTNHRNRVRYDSLKIELWKFLVLWIFGGVYVELGFLPSKFHGGSIHKDDDGFFWIDPKTGMLSTKLMAVSPRHPIMYYAVQSLLLAMLAEGEKEGESSSLLLAGDDAGSRILSRALWMFRDQPQPPDGEKLSPGQYQGVLNRSVNVMGGHGLVLPEQQEGGGGDVVARNGNGWVVSVFTSDQDREAEFRKIGMVKDTIGEKDGGNEGRLSPCFGELYHLRKVSLLS